MCDLVANQPGNEGKWFAAAKDADFFELAIEGQPEPIRPEDAYTRRQGLCGGTTGFRVGGRYDCTARYRKWMRLRYTSVDVLDAYAAVMAAAGAAGMDEAAVKTDVWASIW